MKRNGTYNNQDKPGNKINTEIDKRASSKGVYDNVDYR